MKEKDELLFVSAMTFIICCMIWFAIIISHKSYAPVSQVRESSACVKSILNKAFDNGRNDDPPTVSLFNEAKSWCHAQKVRKEEGLAT